MLSHRYLSGHLSSPVPIDMTLHELQPYSHKHRVLAIAQIYATKKLKLESQRNRRLPVGAMTIGQKSSYQQATVIIEHGFG